MEMKKPQSRKKALGIIHRYCPMQFTSNQQKEFVRQIKKTTRGKKAEKIVARQTVDLLSTKGGYLRDKANI